MKYFFITGWAGIIYSLFIMPSRVDPLSNKRFTDGQYRFTEPFAPSGDVNPNDLVGYLDPLSKILFTTSKSKQQVLSSFGAEVQPGGMYLIHSSNLNDNPFNYTVSVLLTTPADIADKSAKGAQQFACDGLLGPAPEKVYDPDKHEWATDPEMIKDKTGAPVKVYQNAECVLLRKAKPDAEDCRPDIDEVEENGMIKYRRNGKFCTYDNLDWYICIKGIGICHKVLKPVRIKYVYKDKACSNMLDVVKEYDWGCK